MTIENLEKEINLQIAKDIKKYLEDTAEKKAYTYRFNPRSRRLEKVEE